MMLNEPNAMREIHAIRTKNFEQTKDLSPEDRSRLRRESTMHIAEKHNFRIVSRQENVKFVQREAV